MTRWALAAAACLLVVLTLVQIGAMKQRQADTLRNLQQYRETNERIRDAIDRPRSPDDVLERLRRHAVP